MSAPSNTQSFSGFGGTSAFGAAAPTTSAPAFNFGPGTSTFGTTTNAFGGTSSGFGAPAATSTFGGTATFGGGAPPAFGSTFGGGASAFPQTGFGGFGGAAKTSAPSLFSGGFGQTTTTQSGFGGFGGGMGTGMGTGMNTGFGQTNAFGQSMQQQQQGMQQQQQQQGMPQQGAALTPDEAFMSSLFKVAIFNDERDKTLARWNHLQAMWGTGKAFINQTQPPLELDPQNILSRFKTISYGKVSGKDNKAGLVALTFNKSLAQLKDQQQQIVATLSSAFGNKPNIVIGVDSTKGLTDTKSQLVIYVEEKLPTNETKRAPANDVGTYLNQPMTKQQLANLGVDNIFAFIQPDEDQLKEYLDTVPKGIDPRVWQQAKKDNPDPKKFLPVPIIGFSGLKWRIKCQESETESQSLYLQKLDRDIITLKQRQTNTAAKIQEHKRKLAELSHRALKIIVKQESTRKAGIALTPDEEAIRAKLESMHTIVSAPTQFKGRLNELLSQVRMQRNQWRIGGASNEYALDKDSTEEVKNFIALRAV